MRLVGLLGEYDGPGQTHIGASERHVLRFHAHEDAEARKNCTECQPRVPETRHEQQRSA
jgi:hypothetical protein